MAQQQQQQQQHGDAGWEREGEHEQQQGAAGGQQQQHAQQTQQQQQHEHEQQHEQQQHEQQHEQQPQPQPQQGSQEEQPGWFIPPREGPRSGGSGGGRQPAAGADGSAAGGGWQRAGSPTPSSSGSSTYLSDDGSWSDEGEGGGGTPPARGRRASRDELPLAETPSWVPDYTFKLLLIGDSGVGKTCLVMRFISDRFEDHLPSTVGVDFATKRMAVHGSNIKVTIWDTAGQERFRALTATFYRNAKGIIFVYDVTRRSTLLSLEDSWISELDRYDPLPQVARMVVANKVDQHEAREVTWAEGADFAKRHGCLFVETSAKQNIAVGVAFEELVLRILDTPSLLEADDDDARGGGGGAALRLDPSAARGDYSMTCSC